jgi:glycine oxidase
VQVSVIGAGVAGLSCALELAERGVAVEVLERAVRLGGGGCSWYAGGMLAPWCERESAEPLIAQLGEEGLPWWRERVASTCLHGTLVVAHGRDVAELADFGRRTSHYERVGAEQIAALEPDLAGRFAQGLYFAAEGHLDPRMALAELAGRLEELGVPVRFGIEASAAMLGGRSVIDCTGLAARRQLPDLRGVKGEMLLLRAREVSLTRPVRVLHPRLPVYVVPRGEGLFMVGATMLESDAGEHISARSMLELLAAACALHPAFGEAQIIEIGTGVRAAFPDNRPRLRQIGGALCVNGLFRHGFLLAPALARRAARVLTAGEHFPEVMDEDPGERRLA